MIDHGEHLHQIYLKNSIKKRIQMINPYEIVRTVSAFDPHPIYQLRNTTTLI